MHRIFCGACHVSFGSLIIIFFSIIALALCERCKYLNIDLFLEMNNVFIVFPNYYLDLEFTMFFLLINLKSCIFLGQQIKNIV